MELIKRRRELIFASGTNNIAGYQTEFELTGDTKFGEFIREASCRMHFAKPVILIRAAGQGVPSIGDYTVNNFVLVFSNGNRVSCMHAYAHGRVSADAFGKNLNVNESDGSYLLNGVLYNDSTSQTCIGTTGTKVKIIELDNLFGL